MQQTKFILLPETFPLPSEAGPKNHLYYKGSHRSHILGDMHEQHAHLPSEYLLFFKKCISNKYQETSASSFVSLEYTVEYGIQGTILTSI